MATSLAPVKVIILAAGRSTRMDPLPDKNFISFCGKPLIEWQVAQLRDAGFSKIAVIGGRHNLEELRHAAGSAHVTLLDKNERTGPSKKSNSSQRKAKLLFEIIEQKRLEDGMAGAVLAAESWISDSPFLVVSSNDIVEDSIFEVLKKGLKSAEKSTSGFIVAKHVKEYFPGGYLKVKKNGNDNVITGIVEKPGAGKEPSDLVNIVFHVHLQPKKLFAALKHAKTSRDDRYEVALDALIQENMHSKTGSSAAYVALPYSGFWQPIKYPWHLIEVWKIIFDRVFFAKKGTKKSMNAKPIISKKATIAKSAIIRGKVVIEDGVKVFDHAVVQGPAYIGSNSIIANNALVRDSHLGEGSVAGYSTEIARSFLADGVWTHTNYIGDSIIGRSSSFGSGTVTGNLRLDEGPISVVIGGEKVNIGSNKLGAIVGENVRVGINTCLMPGVKIGNNCFIGAGISLSQDIPDSKFVYGKWELTIKDNSAKINPSARQIMMQKLK